MELFLDGIALAREGPVSSGKLHSPAPDLAGCSLSLDGEVHHSPHSAVTGSINFFLTGPQL